MEYVYTYDSPLGRMRMASDGVGLSGLWFEGQSHFAAEQLSGHQFARLPVFEAAVQWMDLYFSGRRPDFTPPLCLRGSGFRMAVWSVLLQIPYGETSTYGEIAAQIARQRGRVAMSAQAVGGAVGHNPVSLIVPCHRVVGSDGSLTGYAGGLWRKDLLLRLERGEVSWG